MGTVYAVVKRVPPCVACRASLYLWIEIRERLRFAVQRVLLPIVALFGTVVADVTQNVFIASVPPILRA